MAGADMSRKTVRIGNGQGFWGDSMLGPTQLVHRGELDYLTMDFLAEVTMSILRKQHRRRSDAGYATDFVEVIERVLPTCRERGIKVVANAGGVNPAACADACEAVVRKLGLSGVRIAVVEGDDVVDDLDALIADGEAFTNIDTDEPLRGHLGDVVSANVYLGAAPIAEALGGGADIVITGRVVDAALTVGPLLHEFGWSLDDYDRLAAATVAGHIIECGTQCTGGNFDRWEDVPNMADIGYPVVEVHPDGTFVVTKQPGTGGMVTTDTVTAQLLYEIGDPARYLTPDVTADFTTIRLTDEGDDRVRVDGVRGAAPPPDHKVSVSLQAGWRAFGQLVVAGPGAARKAEATAGLLWDRLAADGVTFTADQRIVEVLGTGVVLPGANRPDGPSGRHAAEATEVVLRVGVRHGDRTRVDRFGRELASLLTSGPPGLTGFAAGRPKASEVVAFWPALIGRHRVRPTVRVREVA